MELDQEILEEAILQHLSRMHMQVKWHVRDIANRLGVWGFGKLESKIKRQFIAAIAKAYPVLPAGE